MTKAELVKKIADKTGIQQNTILAVVESTMANIKEALANDEPVYLRGFGTFANKLRKEKPARNITKNVTIIVPKHRVPCFKPGREFKDVVKKA